uniref:AMP-dependent synthetase/ligase domain-containing protein n=1 Tax=Romanomermis culicivorax TaxID=13658 RepID=A0A915HJK9_ROMCU
MQVPDACRLDRLVTETNDNDAVYFDDGVLETKMTYRQMQSLADNLASKLQSITLKEMPIGVIMDNNVFVPAESLYCVDHLFASIHTLMTGMEECCTIQSESHKIFVFSGSPKPPVPRVSILENPAYLVRTSGSTGSPKFVLVPHEAIIPNVIDFKSLFEVSCDDIIALGSPMIFDPSIIDIFVALSSGAKLLIIPERLKPKSNILRRLFFDKYKISVLLTTPSFIKIFDDQTLKLILIGKTSLKCLTLQGEPFPVEFIRKFLPVENRLAINLFNSYGVTEVSSLATCCRVTPEMIKKGHVPLGNQLSKTEISVQFFEDSSGFHHYVDSNRFGFVLIGGKERSCLINAEHLSTFPDPWFTGDIVRVDEKTKEIFHIGRRDYQIKRQGKRINLEEISAAAMKFEEIKTSTCIFDNNTEKIVCALEFSDLSMTSKDIRRILNRIKELINSSMPNYARPDDYLIFDAFPLTVSGKVDRLAIHKEFSRKEMCTFEETNDDKKFSYLDRTLEFFARETLNLPDEVNISPQTYLWNLGCDSLKSLHFITLLNKHFRKDFSECFDCVVFETFGTLADRVKDLLQDKKIIFEDHRYDSSIVDQSIPKSNMQMIERSKNIRIFRKASFIESNLDVTPSNFLVEFSHDMKKCIDAPPLIVEDDLGAHLYVGSHSHRFVCLNALNGLCIWSIELPDRIESSANVSPCGLYIIVGCYDGALYFVNRLNGTIYWFYKTDGMIKCTVACSAHRPCTYFGSYDGFLYAVNYQMKALMFKVRLDSPILSSPSLIENDAIVVAATLKGSVSSFSAENGKILWRYEIHRPIFADLIFVERNNQIVIFGVNGSIHCLKAGSGMVVQEMLLPDSSLIFKTPCLSTIDNSLVLLIATQNGHLYSYQYNENLEKWSFRWSKAVVDSPLSSPAVLMNSSSIITVFLLTASGHTIILHLDLNGNVTKLDDVDLRSIDQSSSAKNMPISDMGEIFSSPNLLMLSPKTFYYVKNGQIEEIRQSKHQPPSSILVGVVAEPIFGFPWSLKGRCVSQDVSKEKSDSNQYCLQNRLHRAFTMKRLRVHRSQTRKSAILSFKIFNLPPPSNDVFYRQSTSSYLSASRRKSRIRVFLQETMKNAVGTRRRILIPKKISGALRRKD